MDDLDDMGDEAQRPFWLAGKPTTSAESLDVHNPYDGRLVARVAVPSDEQVEHAVASAHAVRREAEQLPVHVRADALLAISGRLAARAEDVARLITDESGKPLRWARTEVSRAVATFRWAAEEARRFDGDLQRLDTEPGTGSRLAITRRFPIGPVLAVTPFNFPLNLVAHKLAPALAVGAPVIVKPAPTTPLSALLLAELVADTDLPGAMLSVLPVPNDRAEPLVRDERLPVLSFTGSGPVGWRLNALVPHKHVTLELGGNAAAIVHRDADVQYAAARVAVAGNAQAGQSCISTQRVLVHSDVHDEFVEALLAHVAELRLGDPYDDAVDVGPLITEAAAVRVEQWVDEALGAGARLLAGGGRDGAVVAPTVLVDVPRSARVSCEEVFGPVLVVSAYDEVDRVFAEVNDSPYGLQAGIFTSDLELAFRAHRELEVGGVVVGDVPTFRADQMAYGGVKASGRGREGVRYAMEDVTTPRVLVLSGVPL